MGQKLNILYVSADPRLGLSSGAGYSVHMKSVIEGFRRAGHHVECMIAGSEKFGNASRSLFPVLKKILPKSSALFLRDFVEAAQDILNLRKIRLRLQNRKFDFIYERYAAFHFAASMLGQRLRIPHILEVNSPEISERAEYEGFSLQRLGKKLELGVIRSASAVLVVSNTLREILIGEGISPQRIFVVPNAVDCELFNPYKVQPAILEGEGMQDKVVVGFVGSLARWHGVEVILGIAEEILSNSNQFHFLIVGEGKKSDYLKSVISLKGISQHFTLTGAVSHDTLPSLLQAMDITIAPYPKMKDFYFSPLKLFEYMAMEKPIVASKIGQIDEILGDGHAILVEPGNAQEFAKAITNLADQPGVREQMGKKVRQKAQGCYTWDSNIKRIEDIYHKIKMEVFS